MARKILEPEGVTKPISYYSDGMLVGPVLYSAGQAALGSDGVVVGKGNAFEQAKLVFYFLSQVLKEGGMDFSDVVRLNIYAMSRDDIPAILKVKDENFKNHQPSMSVVVIEGAAKKDFLLEAEFTAYKKPAD